MNSPSFTLYLASGNLHKLHEFRLLASDCGLGDRLVLRSAREAGGMPPVDENQPDFEGNARLKALALWPQIPEGAFVLSDDSGLCVDALGGAPGVISARYAGEGANDARNLALLLDNLKSVPPSRRKAHFTCVLVLAGPKSGTTLPPAEKVFEGRCEGYLLEAPRGLAGFGYDPVFCPEGHALTFAELGDTFKSTMSHRALAARSLFRFLAEKAHA